MTLVRVLVVDDSPFARKAFRRVLAGRPGVLVVGEAADGHEALQQCRTLGPDVVLLDLGMPGLDGLGALDLLRRERPEIQVVVVSASAQRGAEATLAALEKGAFDFVDKAAVSSMELHALGDEIAGKVLAAAEAGRFPAREVAVTAQLPEVLVMAASTGGPQALRAVLQELPADFPAPVLVVQHMPPGFLGPLAERVAQCTRMPCGLGTPGQRLVAGHIYFMPGGGNAEVRRQDGELRWAQLRARPEHVHVPSADALFWSAARQCGPGAWGVLLTGMGRDGAEGLLAIHKAGGLTVAQDAASCAVFGMPRVAQELGAVREGLPLHRIAPFLTTTFRSLERTPVQPARERANAKGAAHDA